MKPEEEKAVCPNCGNPVTGNEKFCPSCGQKLPAERLTLRDLFASFFNKYFSLDSAWIKTSISLLYQPALIASAYISGKRKTYSGPLAMLISLSVIYLSVWQLSQITNARKNKNKEVLITTRSFQNKKLDSIFRKENFIRILGDSTASFRQKDSVVKRLFYLMNQPEYIQTARIITDKTSHAKDSPDEDEFYLFDLYQVENYFKKHHIPYQNRYLDTIRKNFTAQPVWKKTLEFAGLLISKEFKNSTPEELIEQFGLPEASNLPAARKAAKLTGILNDPDFINRIYSKITLVLLILIPVFGFFIFLAYRKRKYNYVEILVFLFYLQSSFLLGLLIVKFLHFITPAYFLNTLLLIWFYLLLIMNWRQFFNQRKLSKTLLQLNLFVIPLYMLLVSIGLILIISTHIAIKMWLQ